MMNIKGSLSQIKTSAGEVAHNVRHPQAYLAARQAKFADGVEKNVQVLTTSERGFLGRIIDKIKIAFGSKGTLGDVVHLAYCQNQLKKYVITQKKDAQALSHKDAPVAAFKAALKERATLSKLPVSDKMMKAYTKQMLSNTFSKKLNEQEVKNLVKTAFTTDGYSTKTKVAIGASAIAATALVGAGAYGYFVSPINLGLADAVATARSYLPNMPSMPSFGLFGTTVEVKGASTATK